MIESVIPPLPVVADKTWELCRKNKDFMPILFDWYRYVGIVCNTLASLSLRSPALHQIPSVHYAVLTGLLNRCSRLILANIRLSIMKRYRETTSLLDRCILESAIKVQWLCLKKSQEAFSQFLADGLRKDLILKHHVQRNIEKRGGDHLAIEQRMIRSIDRCVRLSALSEDQINETTPLPNLARIMDDLHLPDAFYIAIQRMGSHPVHGTWTDLVSHYLEEQDNGTIRLRDHNCRPYPNQFVIVPLFVLGSLKSFLGYVILTPEDAHNSIAVLDRIESEIERVNRELVGVDFEIKQS